MTALGNKWYLRQAAYMSMRRLGVEQIDLYYLHTAAFTDVPFEEAIQTLADMKADRLIRYIGLSNLSAEQLRTAMSITVAMRWHAQGPSLAVSTACATGNHMIGEGWHVIRRGDADLLIAGGTK